MNLTIPIFAVSCNKDDDPELLPVNRTRHCLTLRDLPPAVNRPVGCKKNRRHKKKCRVLSGSHGQDVTDRGEAMKKRQ